LSLLLGSTTTRGSWLALRFCNGLARFRDLLLLLKARFLGGLENLLASFELAPSFPLNIVVITLMYAAWFGITVGVLCGMDVMECFLHTLRLHWVEFQSKFYKADGYEFYPYRHKTLLEPKGE